MVVTYEDEQTIRVVDTQEITYYESEEILNKNKTVTYDFRQDDTEEYYLYQVTSK